MFDAEEIADMRETMASLPGLRRLELAATLCAHLP
jgi:hypothetical protein